MDNVALMMSPEPNGFAVAEHEVRDELTRILTSQEFERAESLGRMVQYVVDRTLLGDTAGLKEYVVGVEAFELPTDFDPKCCALVRVQAIRLRRKLERYYSGSGANNPVRIAVPKGGYAARFERKPAARAACA
jgi:hypothetical protein